jgi:hypothetical protein
MIDIDEVCMCSYKANACFAGNTTVVYQQGWYLMRTLQLAKVATRSSGCKDRKGVTRGTKSEIIRPIRA